MKRQREKKRRIELFRASYCSLDSKTTVTVDRTAFIYETRSTFDFLLKISAGCFLVRGMCPVSDVMLGRTRADISQHFIFAWNNKDSARARAAHCSDKIILGAQGEVKKVLIIPWYNWNILPEEDLECNEIIQRAAFPRHVIFSFRILCPLRSFNAEQNNSEEFLFL